MVWRGGVPPQPQEQGEEEGGRGGLGPRAPGPPRPSLGGQSRSPGPSRRHLAPTPSPSTLPFIQTLYVLIALKLWDI